MTAFDSSRESVWEKTKSKEDKIKRKPTALKGQKIFMEALEVFLILTAVGQA